MNRVISVPKVLDNPHSSKNDIEIHGAIFLFFEKLPFFSDVTSPATYSEENRQSKLISRRTLNVLNLENLLIVKIALIFPQPVSFLVLQDFETTCP